LKLFAALKLYEDYLI